MSRCVVSQEGERVVGRRRFGEAEHRAFGAMASLAFVVRFSALGRNRSPKRQMRAKPTPLFMEEQRIKKEEFIRIRVAGWQKKYISLQAEKAHKSLSQYVRDAAMEKDVTVIDGVDDLIRELRRQGNNLNQLVVMARQGHVELVNMEPFMEVYDRPVSGRSGTARAAGGLLSGADHRPAAGRAPRPAVDGLGRGEYDYLCQQAGKPHQR